MNELNDHEKLAVAIMRLNAETPKLAIKKTWHVGQLEIQYHWRSSKNLWGRFGGGWNWKIGIQAGGSTMIVELLVFSLRFNWEVSKCQTDTKS